MQYEQDILRHLQLAELEILKDIDRVCREYGIAYWLDSGTVLGARCSASWRLHSLGR